MPVSRTLAEMESIKALATVFSTCTKVNRYDREDEPESWTLAFAFSEIEESVAKIYNELIPKLTQGELGSDEIYDLLFEAGEELRHVLYHIRDPQFFRYLE